jgi:hypothetical protein
MKLISLISKKNFYVLNFELNKWLIHIVIRIYI